MDARIFREGAALSACMKGREELCFLYILCWHPLFISGLPTLKMLLWQCLAICQLELLKIPFSEFTFFHSIFCGHRILMEIFLYENPLMLS